MATGLGSNAVKAPFGRILLITANEELLAIKITKHRGGKASDYQWKLWSGETTKEGKGELDEAKSQLVVAQGSMKVTWSAGDWFYMKTDGSDNILMARTEFTEFDEVRGAIEKARWLSVKDLQEMRKRDLDGLRDRARLL